MFDDEDEEKRREEAKSIISGSSIGNSINSINYANLKGININAQSEEEQNFVNKVNEANNIINSINPRQNVPAPSFESEEDRIKSKQNAQKLIDLMNNNVEKTTVSQNEDYNIASKQQRDAVDLIMNKKSLKEIKEGNDVEQPEEKKGNILTDIKGFFENLFFGGSSGAKQVLKYNEVATENNFDNYKKGKEQQYLNSQNVSEENKAQVREANNLLLHTNKNKPLQLASKNVENYNSLLKTPNDVTYNQKKEKNGKLTLEQTSEPSIETNLMKKTLQDSIDNDTLKVQENIANTTTPVFQKLNELAPSIGQMTVGWGTSAINPMLGISYFMTSAGGSYIDDAKERGMNEEESFMYGTIMGAMEGITEEIGISKLMKGGKSLSKGAIKEALKNYGLNAADNFIQEAVIEPISEATATVVGGKDTANWDNTAERMLQAGIDGALSSALIMDGASAGINSSIRIVDKIKNNQNISQKEMKKAIQDINNNENIDVENTVKNEVSYQVQNMTNTDSYMLTRYNKENDNLRIYDVKGEHIDINKNDYLDIAPAVVKVGEFYNVIDTNTGLELYTTTNKTKQNTVYEFKDIINNLDNAGIQNINNQVAQTKLALINKMQEIQNNPQALQDFQIQGNQNINQLQKNNVKREYTKEQYDNISKTIDSISDKTIYNNTASKNLFKTVSNNIENVNYIEQSGKAYINSLDSEGNIVYQQKLDGKIYTGKKIKNIFNDAIRNADTSNIYITNNADNSQTISQPNTSNFYSNETNYAVQDIKKVTEPFNKQETYSRDELAERWNNDISNNNYDAYYNSDGNIEKYIAIEEDGNNIVVNQYDNNDNIVKSEVISSNNGRYSAKDIQDTIDRVASLYDENRPIKGQQDIEGNEVISMKKKTNKTTLSDKEIQNIVKYNQDGREIKDTNYIDFMVQRLKDRNNVSRVETTTNEIVDLLDNTYKKAEKMLGNVATDKNIRNKQQELIIDILYKKIPNKNFKDTKILKTETGDNQTVTLNLEITKKGIKESIHKSISNEKLAVIPYLDTLIKTSKDGLIRNENKQRNNMKWYYLYNTAEINSNLYAVKIDIRKTPQGDRFYVHRVNLIEEKGAINQIPSNESATIKINKTPSSTNSIAQKNQTVKNTATNNSMQNNTLKSNTTSTDNRIRSMKKSTSNNNNNKANKQNTTVDKEIRFAKKTAKPVNDVLEPGQRNAERGSNYIEDEIQKIEKTGQWDNSIPVTKMTDIRKTIEDYLGIGVQKGHFKEQAYGIYKGNRDVIRTKELKDMDTILHETGHALDIGKRIKLDKESISNELLTAIKKYGGYETDSRQIQLEEGFAEVIRKYAIVPEQAKQDYPQTVSILEGIRQTDKSFNDFITKVQQQTYNYIHQSPRNRGGLSNMSIGEKTDQTKWTPAKIQQEVMRNIYDKDWAIKSAVNEMQKINGKSTTDLKASENAYYLTRLANGIGDKISSMLSKGYIDENGNKLMPGLEDIGEILNNDPERINDLRAYLVAQRDLEYKAKTLKTGIRTSDSRAIVNQFKNDTQIQEASKLVYDTLDGVMQYAVNNGLINQETADTLKQSNTFYVPMQRVLEGNKNNVGRKGAVSEIIKERTGSELDIKDILENVISNSSNIIQQIENNNILKALYKQGEQSGMTGKIYDVIDAPMVKVGTAKLNTWQNELKNQGVNISKIDFEKTIDLFAPNNKVDANNLITSFINDNGKRVYLQFNDKILFDSLMNMDKNFMSKILNFTSKFNMPLRYGATMANIGFAIPNMVSDTAQAAIFSEAGFIPVVDNLIGIMDVVSAQNKNAREFFNKVIPGYADKINTLYAIYEQTGATSSTRMSQYRETTQNLMKDVYGSKNSEVLGIKEKYKPLKRFLDIMTYIPEISEQSTRFRVFEKNIEYYRKNGMSETDARIQAALQSRDATQDFGRTGYVTKEINQLIPFSSARVGSAYTFAEKVKANPKRVATRMAVLMAISMAIKAIGYDDKEIEELNQRKKDDNFIFKLGDQIITIKKPQGILRSIINLGEYVQDLFTGHIEEGKEGERLTELIQSAIMDNMPADDVTGLVPNMVAPVVENAINKDLYYNTDIVKSYDLELPDSEQYYDYNSQLAIWLGKIFNYSPAKIDNLISGYFAGLGTSVTNIIDYIAGKTGITSEQPEMGAEDNAVGKRFFVNVNSNSASVDEIYTLKTDLTKKKNGGTITSEEDQLETITEAISEMSKLNKQIKEIKKDLTKSGKQKADEIKELQKQKTDTARQALGKDLLYSNNASKIESTKFYPTRDTLSKNKRTLTMNAEMKKEYEQIASEYYNKYASQGIYNQEKLEQIEEKARDYAKNEMMKKYKSELSE